MYKVDILIVLFIKCIQIIDFLINLSEVKQSVVFLKQLKCHATADKMRKYYKKILMSLVFAGVSGAIMYGPIQADSYTAPTGSTNLKDTLVEDATNKNLAGMATEEQIPMSLIKDAVPKNNVINEALDATHSEEIKEKEIELQKKFREEKIKKEEEKRRKAEEEKRKAMDADIVSKLSKNLNGVLSGKADFFAETCKKYGVDPYLAAAISAWETGHGTSSLAVNNNNVGGMRYRGQWLYYDTIEAGIEAFIKNIYNNYIAYGMTSPETMVDKYAEGSAGWVNGVNSIMYSIKNS